MAAMSSGPSFNLTPSSYHLCNTGHCLKRWHDLNSNFLLFGNAVTMFTKLMTFYRIDLCTGMTTNVCFSIITKFLTTNTNIPMFTIPM